jgi:hypothetical protein
MTVRSSYLATHQHLGPPRPVFVLVNLQGAHDCIFQRRPCASTSKVRDLLALCDEEVVDLHLSRQT